MIINIEQFNKAITELRKQSREIINSALAVKLSNQTETLHLQKKVPLIKKLKFHNIRNKC